jgi:arabinose-5-phosphate isomerase
LGIMLTEQTLQPGMRATDGGMTLDALRDWQEATVLTVGKQVLALELNALQALHNRLDDSFTQAVTLIRQTLTSLNGRVVVTGMGKSGHVGRKIAATLASTGTPSGFLHPAEGRHGDLGMVTSNDIVVALSNSGETEEVLGLLPTLNHLGVPVVAMTAKLQSTLARLATVVLDTYVAKEAGPLGLAPTASTTVTLALGDALAIALQVQQGFSSEQFALYHPAGALGKRLLLKVSDLMHALPEQLPLLSPTQPMLDALITVSEKRLGLGLVCNQETGALIGIMTDGDIRRAVQTHLSQLEQLTVEAVMSVSPKTIEADTLASKALTLMEQHHITALAVINNTSANLPIGVLHLHDLLQNGL